MSNSRATSLHDSMFLDDESSIVIPGKSMYSFESISYGQWKYYWCSTVTDLNLYVPESFLALSAHLRAHL